MKRALLSTVVAVIALTSVTGSGAMAQGWESNQRGPNQVEHEHGGPGHPDQNMHRDDRRDDHRGPPRAELRHDRRIEAREARHWRAGDRLPPDYRGRRYIVAKPVVYHLHPPPRGHHWVRVGSDAFLVIAASGIVVEVAPGIFR